jgi:beta-N-acetylhexosaminidase
VNTVGLTTSTADRKRRAAQRLMIGLAGPGITAEERSFLREVPVGGFILFARNVQEPRQVLELNRELASLIPREVPPFRAVDQEGGRVRRLLEPATTWPPMRHVGNVDDPRLSFEVGAALGREVRACGFDVDFAPVADVDSNPKNPVIGDRAFSSRPDRVAAHVTAFIAGMQGEGCVACAKHFPGHGDTAADSHLELPVVEREPPDLDETELPPFAASIRAGVGSVMTAHVMYPAWDTRFPATMSEPILRGILRDRLGFGGLVFSDDLEMKAVRDHYALELQLERASAATCDMFLCCKELALAAASWEVLVHLQESSKAQEDAAIDAVKRIHGTRERFFLGRAPAPPLDVLGSPAHKELALRAEALGRA